MTYNSILPKSSESQLKDIEGLREKDNIRDSEYSPLFDAILNNIQKQAEILLDKETYRKVWTRSIFPERLAKAILRNCEEFIINQSKEQPTYKRHEITKNMKKHYLRLEITAHSKEDVQELLNEYESQGFSQERPIITNGNYHYCSMWKNNGIETEQDKVEASEK